MQKRVTKKITLLFTILLFAGCSKDSITEAELGTNSITLSGSISKSFEANTFAGVTDDYSGSSFNLFMHPNSSETLGEQFWLSKSSSSLPEIGKYNISKDFFYMGENFTASYIIDGSLYFMMSGDVEILESSYSRFSGNFAMSGYLVEFPIDSTNVLNITGEFSVVPEDF